MYLLFPSFSSPLCQALLHLLSRPVLLLVNWGTSLSVSVWRWLEWNQVHTAAGEKGRWDSVASAQRGARLQEAWGSTGQCWPASRRRGSGDRAQWSAANLSFRARHRVFTVPSGVLLDCRYIENNVEIKRMASNWRSVKKKTPNTKNQEV